jgi:hypothetical protein
MTVKRLFAILFIYLCTAVAWFVLSGAIDLRTSAAARTAAGQVDQGWGPAMVQSHPTAYYQSPGSRDGRAVVRPSESRVEVQLASDPKRRGLVNFRTYGVSFSGEYIFENPTPIPQTLFVRFELPTALASYTRFSYTLAGRPTTANVTGGAPITEAVLLQPGEKTTLAVMYQTRGVDNWGYAFGSESRVRNFSLRMTTNFTDIDFPPGTASASARVRNGAGWKLDWSYPDEIGARAIGMAMPKVLNPGPTAARITLFAPVSLLFFFAALVIICLLQKVDLHPMNFFFLGAGCFAFQLLFAYLVDLVPMEMAFALSAAVSLLLVSGYLFLAFGARFARWAALAQFSYMVLFSYSFFFDGLTGLTITVGAIITLAILMVTTAKVNWSAKFGAAPPPIPGGPQLGRAQ